tara:strand:- start:3248 stop:3484 length:237 start_codon:yes stop_codon:yes gene_type:complete
MDWTNIAEWVFEVAITAVFTSGIYIFKIYSDKSNETMNKGQEIMERAVESIERLNIRMAVVIERLEGHEKRINRLEEK